MVPSNRRRVVLYLSSAVVLSGLVYAGFIYKAEPDIGMLISCAQAQIEARAVDGAEPFVARILEREPDSFEGLMLRGAIFELRENWGAALEQYRALLPRAGSAAMEGELRFAIARLEREQGHRRRAEQELAKIESPAPETKFKIHQLRCVLLIERGALEKAREQYEQAAAIAPEAPGLAELRAGLGIGAENNSKTPSGSDERPNQVQVTPGGGR